MVDIVNIDIKLFTKQRESLNELILTGKITPEIKEHLEGLQNLLDNIYDQLVPDNLGE